MWNPFKRKTKRKIYAYTREQYLCEGNDLYPVKVGDTSKKDSRERIDEQHGAGNEYGPVIIYESSWVNFKDKKVHKEIEKLGGYKLPDRYGKDWYMANGDMVARAVNSLLYGKARPNGYVMRPEQQEAVERAYRLFTGGGTKFLWNCKMRFGKTFAAYQLIKKLNAKKVLVITYKPATVEEWRRELEDHVDFAKYNFVRAIEAGKEKIVLKKWSVLFTSFQDILQDFEYDEENIGNSSTSAKLKPKFENLLKERFDLVIVDEVHYGATNLPAQILLGQIDSKFELHLSGTPIKIINRGELNEEQIFTWTYLDEQSKKKSLIAKGVESSENPYWHLPKMTIVSYALGSGIYGDLKYFQEDEKFNFAKFFHSDDGKRFIHAQAVLHFLDLMADKKSSISPYFANIVKDGKALQHTLWVLPSVAACHAMTSALRSHLFFAKYSIICASGDNLKECAAGEELNHLKAAIKNSKNTSEYKGTITLSCGKLTTGITVKAWGAVFMLSNTQAIETYFQTIFRGQSPNPSGNKQDCYVFDFDSDRMLKTVYEYAKANSKGRSLSDTVKELLTTMNLLCYSDNYWVELDAENILDMARFGVGSKILVSKFTSSRLLNLDVLSSLQNNPQLLAILEKTKLFKKIPVLKGVYEISHGIGKGKTKKTKFTPKEYGEDSNKRDKVNDILRQKLIRLMTRLPIFMYLSEYVEERIEDIIQNLEPNLFEEVTGISVEDFLELKSAGIFDLEKLNEAIRAFKSHEVATIKDGGPETEILDTLANLSNEEIFTQRALVNKVLDVLPDSVWTNPNLKWCNPAEKHGIWLREVFKRLEAGLSKQIPNLEERHHWIKSEMLYGYAISDICWMLACKTLYGKLEGGEYIRWRASPYLNNIQNKRFLEVEEMPEIGIILGNVPFQETDSKSGKSKPAGRNLYSRFTIEGYQALPKGGIELFITPKGWFSGSNKELFDIMKKDLFYLNVTDLSGHFPGVSSTFCYFMIEKDRKPGPVVIETENGKIEYSLEGVDRLPKVITEETLSINGKLSNYPNKLNFERNCEIHTQHDDRKEEYSEDYPFPAYYTRGEKSFFSKESSVASVKKVVTFRSGYLRPLYDDGKTGVAQDNLFVRVKSEEEGKFIVRMLESRLYRFYLELNKLSGFHTPAVLKSLPYPEDLPKDFTDRDMYNYFGINEKEVAFIESYIK
jgi:hypothetical protein